MTNFSLLIKFFVVLMVHQSCFSQTAPSSQIDLTCKGLSGGTDIRSEYREFDITVDTVTGEMFNYPERVAMGCIVSPKKGSITCSANRNFIACECKADPLFAERGSMHLSRNTGNLKITTYFKNAIWEGNYSCERVSTRKF
jgi:hypothetical protein